MRVLLGYFVAITLSMLLATSASAELLTEWNYNAETSIGDASTGTGTTTGGGSFPFANTLPNTNGSSADAGTEIAAGLNNQEWTRRGPNAGEDDATRSVTWATSTSGFSDIVFEWDMVAGYRTSKYYQISASSDGTTFAPVSGGVGTGSTIAGVGSAMIDADGLVTVNFDNLFEPEAGTDPVNPIDYLTDLSYAFAAGSGVEDNPNFAVQITPIYGPGNSDFVSSFAGTTVDDAVAGYARSGETDTRFDLASVSGVAVPEPTGMVLAAWGLMFFAVLRRRK